MRSASIQTTNVVTNCRMIAVGTCSIRSQHPQREPAKRRAGDDAAGNREQKRRRHVADREAVCRDRADGEPIDQQRARVVQQAFAFEDRQESMRRPQRPKHRGGGDRIGRSDDGAERDRRRPGHFRDQRAHDDRHGGGGESDGEDDEAGDREPVVAQIPEGCVVGGIEEDRRDEERQRQFRRKRERRGDRNKREQRSADARGRLDTARRLGARDRRGSPPQGTGPGAVRAAAFTRVALA